jgi:polysaccharide deacetylase 2 family uncharacterized protein YibQ
LIVIAVLAVAVIVMWPRRGGHDSGGQLEIPIPLTPAVSHAARAVPPATLLELIRLFVADRRVDVAPGGRDADLLCALPPGGSFFRLNADLTEAVKRWGGDVVAGEELTLPGGQPGCDLTIRRGAEERKIRIIRLESSGGRPMLAIVLFGMGRQSRGTIDRIFRLPFVFTPAIRPGEQQSAWAIRRALELGRLPLIDLGRDASASIGVMAGEPGLAGAGYFETSQGDDIIGNLTTALDRMAEKGFFFLWSGEMWGPAVSAEAALRGVRCLTADVVLDDGLDPDPAKMIRKLRRGCDLALSSGSAIVCAEARPENVHFLESIGDSLSSWGCRPIAVGDLLR